MSVSNGQKANQTTFNNAYVSRTTDDNKAAKFTLDDPDTVSSGASITNTQKQLHSLASFLGVATNLAKDSTPTWLSDAIGIASEAVKARLDAVQTQVETNDSDIATNTGNISTNTTNIGNNTTESANIRTTQGTSNGDTDLGTGFGTIITDSQTVKQALINLETSLSAITDALDFQGVWNANTNTPTLVSSTGTKGHFYIIDTAGTTTLDGISLWNIGDWAVYDGTVWRKIENSVSPDSTTTFTNKSMDASANTFTNFTHGTEVDNPSSGVHGVTGSVVGTTDTQDLSAKTFTDNVIVQEQASTPTTPAAGNQATYPKTDGKWYTLDDSGTETEVGSGSGGGSGGINFITNSDFEIDVSSGWTTYDDGAVSIPVDGTGGSPTIAFDRITTAGLVLSGTASARLLSSSGVNRLGEGVSSNIIISNEYLQKEIIVKFAHTTSSNALSGEFKVFVYDIDNAVMLGAVKNDDDGDIIEGGLDGANSNVVSSRNFVGSFTATDSLNYRIIIHNTSSDTSRNKVMYLDTVKATPDSFGPGAIVTESIDFIPSFTNFTLGNGSIYASNYRRDGQFMDGTVNVTLGSTSVMGTSPSFNVPDSKVVDSNIQRSGASSVVGQVILHESGVDIFSGYTFLASSTEIAFNGIKTQGSGFVDFLTISSVNPFTWGTLDEFQVNFRIPIQDWSASNLISTQEANYLAAATSTSDVQPTGTVTSAYNVIKYGTIDNDPHGLYNTTSGQWTAPRDGFVDVASFIEISYTSATLKSSFLRAANITQAKYIWAKVYDPGTTTTSRLSLAGTLAVDKDDVIEFHIWTDGASGAYPNNQNSFTIKYQETFKSFGVYKNEEHIEAKNNSWTAWGIAANLWGDITSIILPPGEFDLSAVLYTNSTGTTSHAGIFMGIGNVAGAVSAAAAGLLDGDNIIGLQSISTAGNIKHNLIIPSYRVSNSTETIYYMKGHISTSNTNLNKTYRMSARRIS